MFRFITKYLSLQNISPGTTSVILWPRFQVFLAGYIIILLVVFLGVYLFLRFNKHAFSNRRITSSFLLSITSYFFFIWSYLFSFLICSTNLPIHPYNNEIMIIPFTILVIIFFSIFVGSFLWLVISLRKALHKETLSKTLAFDTPIWFQIVFSLGIFVFLPFYYMLYNSQVLKVVHSLPEYLFLKIRSLSKLIITCSIFSFSTLLIGISFLLNTQLHRNFSFIELKGFFFGFLSIGLVLLLMSFISQFLLNRILKESVLGKHFTHQETAN